MSSKPGRIVGHVTYREGDGQSILIPQGPCEITVTDLDATLGWIDGDSSGSTALPLAEFNRYVSEGAIVFDK